MQPSKLQLPTSNEPENNEKTRHLTPARSPNVAEREDGAHGVSRPTVILTTMVHLLGAAALWQPEYGMEFQYRGQRRWAGAWGNPNIYGMLMGVGVVLGIGQAFLSVNSKGQSPGNAERGVRSAEGRRWVRIVLLLTAAGLCSLGLVKSYSRGAWLGAACVLAFLVWKFFNREPDESPKQEGDNSLSCILRIPRLKRNWFPISVILASIFVLTFWQFRHTENPLARRVFSIGNPNDFSWRNRVAAWAGTVTMMKDRPLMGYGWGKSEAVFREKYKPVRLEDAAALQMNDYLMLGISCGVPGLLCLLAYLALAVGRGPNVEGRAPVSLQPSVVAAAGATVLRVGFWFDGGLFRLPTAAGLWVLIELSRGSRRGDEAHANEGGARHSVRAVGGESVFASQPVGSLAPPSGDTSSGCATFSPSDGEKGGGAHGVTRPTVALRWLAGIVTLLAIGQTILHLGTPRLAVSERTLSFARKFLVPPKAETDFEFLATQPIWSAKQLGTLLDHVELAN